MAIAMMEERSKIEIYQIKDKRAVVKVQFGKDTVWLNRQQLVTLFDTAPD